MDLIPTTLEYSETEAEYLLAETDQQFTFEWTAVEGAVQYGISIFKYQTTLIDSLYILLPVGIDALDIINGEFFIPAHYKWTITAFNSDNEAFTSNYGLFVIKPNEPTPEVTYIETVVHSKPLHSLEISRTTDWEVGVGTPLQQEHKRYYDISYASVAVDEEEEPLFTGTAVVNSTIVDNKAIFTNIDIVDGWIYTITPYVNITDTDGTAKKITATPIVTEAIGDINARTNLK